MRLAAYRVVASRLLAAETRRNVGFFVLLDYGIQMDNIITETMQNGWERQRP